jgi:hypothetical protein
MNKKIENFHAAISKILVEKLEKFKGKSLTKDVCLQVYQTIFDSLSNTFQAADINITNESMNYLAQQYYDAVSINGREELNPHIFTQRANLDEVKTSEIALLAMLMKGTDFAYPLYETLRRRS